MKRLETCLFLTLLLIFVTSCGASSNSGKLDSARFALDSCSSSDVGPCNTAQSDALSVLTSDPNNVQAALIRSSALATSDGVNLLDLVSDISSTANNDQKFKSMHDTVVGTMTGVTNLNASILTMLPPIYTGATTLQSGDDYYRDYYFQLGILQAFEAFVMPSFNAQNRLTDPVVVDNITAANKTSVQDDFINADNNLITSGISDSTKRGWDIVNAIRENYCVLITAEGTTSGFSREVLQDLMLCQLCVDVTDTSICPAEASNLGPANFKSGKVAKCSDFDYDGCSNAGPTE